NFSLRLRAPRTQPCLFPPSPVAILKPLQSRRPPRRSPACNSLPRTRTSAPFRFIARLPQSTSLSQTFSRLRRPQTSSPSPHPATSQYSRHPPVIALSPSPHPLPATLESRLRPQPKVRRVAGLRSLQMQVP